MKKEVIAKLHTDFEALVHIEPQTSVEFWFARDLQEILGYQRWENFAKVIERAKVSCNTSGCSAEDHFLHASRTVVAGKGAEREIEDVMLTRYACYLIAQNGDPTKEAIAFAQSYFAIQTRKQELIEKHIDEIERLDARKKLSVSEKQLSGLIFQRLTDEKSFSRIRNQGDQALFGGKNTREMKARLKVPDSRALADFLPTITIKAKDFANEITVFNMRKHVFPTETAIADEHSKNNKEVRRALTASGIRPEDLPADEDVKKVERRLESEKKKLPKNAKSLPKGNSEE